MGAAEDRRRPPRPRVARPPRPHRCRRPPPPRPRPPGRPAPTAAQRFGWPAPNDLWPVDFKGLVWVGRQKVFPLTVLDDHSRDRLAAEPRTDQTMATAWAVLWRVFGEVGLPAAVPCDDAFGTHNPGTPTVSWFDAQLLRVGVRPIHGGRTTRRPRGRSSGSTAPSSGA